MLSMQKLAQEQLDEMAILVNNRFGYGTWQTIIRERAKRIADEKEAARRAKQEKLKKQKELYQTIQVVAGVVLAQHFVLLSWFFLNITRW